MDAETGIPFAARANTVLVPVAVRTVDTRDAAVAAVAVLRMIGGGAAARLAPAVFMDVRAAATLELGEGAVPARLITGALAFNAILTTGAVGRAAIARSRAAAAIAC